MRTFNRIVAGFAFVAAFLVGAPAFAQVDFSGEWAPRFWEDQPERVPGPELGDYLGLPINDAARLRADTVGRVDPDAARMAVPAAFRRLHLARAVEPAHLEGSRSASRARSRRSTPNGCARWIVRSISTAARIRRRTRSTPGPASRPEMGGDTLVITTTHLKEGYLRRNGLPRSDKATLSERWIRNGDFLTVMTIVNDPVYLTEPFVRTTDYELNVHQNIPPYPCGIVQEIDRAKGQVPHFLPGTTPT